MNGGLTMIRKLLLLCIALFLGASTWLAQGVEDTTSEPAMGWLPGNTRGVVAGLVAKSGEQRGDVSEAVCRIQLRDASAPPSVGEDVIRVQVVAMANGEPIPGMEVWVLGELGDLDASEREEAERLSSDPERLNRRFGSRRHANAQGVVWIPCTAWTSVSCRYGDLYGELYLSPDSEKPDGGFRLELERDVRVTVVILEHDGAPAGDVPVVLEPVWQEAQSAGTYVSPAREKSRPSAIFRMFKRYNKSGRKTELFFRSSGLTLVALITLTFIGSGRVPPTGTTVRFSRAARSLG